MVVPFISDRNKFEHIYIYIYIGVYIYMYMNILQRLDICIYIHQITMFGYHLPFLHKKMLSYMYISSQLMEQFSVLDLNIHIQLYICVFFQHYYMNRHSNHYSFWYSLWKKYKLYIYIFKHVRNSPKFTLKK